MSDSSVATARPDSIWTPAFALLCLTQLLGYAHNALLMPVIPLYVAHLGGSAFLVGLVLAAFAATSVLLRPLIGYWADTRSEAGVLASGCFVLGASMPLFFIPVAGAAMLANGLRGVGWAGLNTGGYSLLASSAPVVRRGEASGYYSGVQASASAFFPAVALWLVDAPLGGFRVVILLSATLAAIGGAIGAVLARHASRGVPGRSPRGASVAPAAVFMFVERDVLLAAALLFCVNVTHPAVAGFLVLYAREAGIENVGWYFVVGGATSLLARPTLGRMADRIGWGISLAAGFILESVAVMLLAAASGLGLLLVSAFLYALGAGIGTATTTAVAIQRANPQRRGSAMATFSVAFPLSAGVGALVAGGVAEMAGYFWMFLIVAALGAAGLLITFANWLKLNSG